MDTPVYISADLVLIILLGMTALCRAAVRSANLQRFEMEHDYASYELMLSLRQEHSHHVYALRIAGGMAYTFLLFSVGLEFSDPTLVLIAFGVVLFLSHIVVAVSSSLGERYAERLVEVSLRMARVISTIAYPFSVIMARVAVAVGGAQTEEEAREEMEDEITAIMDEAVQEGTLDADEYRILTNIMQFSDVTVRDVMTPRNVVFSLPSGTTVQQIVDRGELQTYSRFPVYAEESLDEVVGYCLTKDILYAAVHGQQDLTLDKLMREVHYMPENIRLDKVLEEFLTRRQHLFVVVDEYGGVEGLITMEDVVETILGAEIVDEADRVVDMRQLASLRRDHRVKASIGRSIDQESSASSTQPLPEVFE